MKTLFDKGDNMTPFPSTLSVDLGNVKLKNADDRGPLKIETTGK
jgi:hypothetical protein